MVNHQENQATWDEHESKSLLKQYGVDVVDEILTQTEQDALAAGRTLGYPVVLKGCSPRILHKTDAGLVVVGIQDEAQLSRAYQKIVGQVPDLEGVLVQKMIPGKREFLVGMVRDPAFGPCIVFGLGGVFTG
jgi:acyl-CoA synthetase (NDP forming)